jgi:lipid-A-disaccharide synthase
MASSDLLLVAGEASGDLHGAALLKELARAGVEANVFGLGGANLRAQGMETLADFSTLSVVGVGEVVRAIPEARRIFKRLLDETMRRGVRVAVLIDFPEFNLRLARKLRSRGVKVVYYVSPQVWAWRRGRLGTIRRVVDKMLVFFDFEVDFYRGQVDVVHVGHPLIDEVPRLEQAWDGLGPGALPPTFRIALLPGSRKSEIGKMMPTLLEAARVLSSRVPSTFVVIRAPSVSREVIEEAIRDSGFDISIEDEDRFRAIAGSHLALCASGTATLEVGLLGTPLIVAYRVGLVTYLLGRALVRIPDIALVNLVLGERVVPELIQDAASGERLAREALSLLQNRVDVDRQRVRLKELRPRLGAGGASRRAAEEVARTLEEGVGAA